MSTRLYTFRVERDRFWGVVDQVRDYYYREGALMRLAAEMKGRTDSEHDEEKRIKMSIEALDAFRDGNRQTEDLTVQLQVFEEDAEHYIFRVLELGYTFLNNFESQGWEVEPVFYDDGSDLSDEEEALRPLVSRIEAMIENRRYLVVSVVELNDASMYLSGIDMSPTGRAERAQRRYGEQAEAG